MHRRRVFSSTTLLRPTGTQGQADQPGKQVKGQNVQFHDNRVSQTWAYEEHVCQGEEGQGALLFSFQRQLPAGARAPCDNSSVWYVFFNNFLFKKTINSQILQGVSWLCREAHRFCAVSLFHLFVVIPSSWCYPEARTSTTHAQNCLLNECLRCDTPVTLPKCCCYTDTPVMFQRLIAGKEQPHSLLFKISFQAQQELMKQLSILPRDNYSLLSYVCR